MRNPVTTTKRKFDGSAKAPWHGDLVEAGPDGWLVVYYEAPAHRVTSGEPVAHALRYFSLELPLSILASFDPAGALLEFQCDAALPATLRGREIEFVDLDLDLMVYADGLAEERDHATFARHRDEMNYPGHLVAAASEAMRLARQLLARGQAPFDGGPERILGRVLAATGPL